MKLNVNPNATPKFFKARTVVAVSVDDVSKIFDLVSEKKALGSVQLQARVL